MASLVIIPVYASILFILVWFLVQHKRKLGRNKYKLKLGTLYQETRYYQTGPVLYTEIFLITRWMLAFVIIVLEKTTAL
jgi:hypothetical protein